MEKDKIGDDLEYIRKARESNRDYYESQLERASDCIIKKLRNNLWSQADIENKKIFPNFLEINVDDCIGSTDNIDRIDFHIRGKFYGTNIGFHLDHVTVNPCKPNFFGLYPTDKNCVSRTEIFAKMKL